MVYFQQNLAGRSDQSVLGTRDCFHMAVCGLHDGHTDCRTHKCAEGCTRSGKDRWCQQMVHIDQDYITFDGTGIYCDNLLILAKRIHGI